MYLVEVTSSGRHSSFVVAKTRVSPLKTQSIPRLELLSALLLARLMKTITEALATRLPLQALRCFTDSQISLCWIKGTDKDWKPFVQNRVNEIRRLVPEGYWDHCSGKLTFRPAYNHQLNWLLVKYGDLTPRRLQYFSFTTWYSWSMSWRIEKQQRSLSDDIGTWQHSHMHFNWLYRIQFSSQTV